MQVKIYKPTSNNLGLGSLLKEMFTDVKNSRNLAWTLTIRDFKGQYRQSILGVFWAFITPLLNTLVWIFLSVSGAVKIAETGIPYPIYVFTGTMLWSILLESITMPLLQTNSSKSIMSKINFPKEALLISGLYKIGFNTLIKILIMFIALFSMGVYPNFQVLYLPLVFLGIIMFGYTFGVLITPIGMLYNDIGKAVPLVMQFLMYLSPVVYVASGDGLMTKIIKLNPLTALVSTGRSVLTGMSFDYNNYFILIVCFLPLVFFIAWVLYRISIPIIVERNG